MKARFALGSNGGREGSGTKGARRLSHRVEGQERVLADVAAQTNSASYFMMALLSAGVH